MDLYIDRDALARGLSRVQGIIERRSTYPLLSHVLLNARKDGGLRMTATDNEVAYVGDIEANIEVEGQLSVNATSLFQIVRSLPESTVQLKLGNARRLEIRSGRALFRLPGQAAEDFPALPTFVDAQSTAKLTEGDLRRMVECTHFAVAVDDVRYGLNGAHLEAGEEDGVAVLRMVATDGHRLSLAYAPYEGELTLSNMLVPRKALGVLRKLLDRDDSTVEVSFGEGLIRVGREHENFWFRLLDGTQFPEYGTVVPKQSKNKAIVRTDLLMSTLKRVGLVAPDRGRKAVRFMFSENELNIEVHNVERGEIKEMVPMEYSGDPMPVGFNPRYLLDLLQVVKGELVTLEISHPLSPCKIVDPEDNAGFFIVMPMRLD